MKKLHIISLAAVIILILAACTGRSDIDRIADKVNQSQPLSQKDYSAMIDYCGQYARKAQPIQDQINLLPADSPKALKLSIRLADLSSEYVYYNLFSEKIARCSKKEIGSANVDKINTLAPLTWFMAPDWAVFQTSPDAAGFIEDVAPADSDSTVIAVSSGYIPR